MQSLAARLHESQITWVVTWRPPLGIINPTGYRLRYRKTSSSTWSSTRTIGSQQTQYTITGLEEGATYEVEVWATFSNGEGSKTKVTTGSTGGYIIYVCMHRFPTCEGIHLECSVCECEGAWLGGCVRGCVLCVLCVCTVCVCVCVCMCVWGWVGRYVSVCLL